MSITPQQFDQNLNNPSIKTEGKKSSLVIIYHREPHDEVVDENGVIHYVEKKSPNGIVPTLKSFFSSVDQGTWIAWKPCESDAPDFPERVSVENDSYTVKRIPLTQQQINDFYHITSKEAFWPILHSFPYHFTYETSDWANFHEVNRRFAEAAVNEAPDDALIWVHDYNLWLVPHYIRKIKPDAKIVFFHHTPFPAPDIFNILPWREEIIDSLLDCDVVGFHIPRYAENFTNVARSLRSVEVLAREDVSKSYMTPVGTALAEPEVTTRLGYKGREIELNAFPVGTNPKQILDRVNSPEGQAKIREIREEMNGRKLIVSVGRVDYVKGTREMLEAYERLLERRPALHGQIRLMTTSVASAKGMRIYDEPQQQIEHVAGRINGKYSTFEWTPVVLTTNPVPFEDLVCYFKAADICWVTPLRDGLNLVNKEYIVAKGGEDGALILSEFTGAAVELPDALLTNPYSQDRMDTDIDRALDMSPEEQKARMSKMYHTVTEYDAQRWADQLFKLLGLEVNVTA
jgi:glucosylglycerol-phosphate synthase